MSRSCSSVDEAMLNPGLYDERGKAGKELWRLLPDAE